MSLITLNAKEYRSTWLHNKCHKIYPSGPFGIFLCFILTISYLRAPTRRRSNSIPWCTSFHVILSLRTWHTMISNLQHAPNEHRSARCRWFWNMFHFSSFCFWDYRVGLYSLCFSGKFQRYFDQEGFYMCFTDLSRATTALGRNYKHKVRDSATDNNW